MSANKMLGTVVYKTNLASNTWLVWLDFKDAVNFLPGQFVSIKVNEAGLRRSYSVASLPGKKSIDLIVDVSPMGEGSKYILGLSVGDEVDVLGFMGGFVVDGNVVDKGLLFVGSGAGVAPLKPMIEDLLVNKKFGGQIYLYWGMRYEEDLYWMKEIDKLQKNYDNFHFEVVLSKPSKQWLGLKGHVQEFVGVLNLDWKNIKIYLCGNPDMIIETRILLTEKKVKEEDILYERFA